MNVRLVIDTTRSTGDQNEDLQLATDGNLKIIENGYILTYKESKDIGADNVITTITVCGDCITMQRSGSMNTLMVMEKGKRTHCEYDTGMGSLLMGIYTSNIKSNVSRDGGEINFNYTLDINNDLLSSHDVKIQISGEKSNEHNKHIK